MGPRPLPRPTVILTPPPSPRKRRELIRSSDDCSGDLSIEKYLYKSDQFRCSSARNPLPLPVARGQITVNEVDVQKLTALIPEIRVITDDKLKEILTIRFVDTWKPNYPNGHIRTPTLLIEVHQGVGPSDLWFEVRDDIQSLLENFQLNVVEIEILDVNRAFTPSIYPEDPATPTIELYEGSRLHILITISKMLREN